MAPAGAEDPARFAARSGGDEQRGDAVAVFVRECDGVYSEDGTRLIESRLLLREPEIVPPVHLALAEGGGG